MNFPHIMYSTCEIHPLLPLLCKSNKNRTACTITLMIRDRVDALQKLKRNFYIKIIVFIYLYDFVFVE